MCYSYRHGFNQNPYTTTNESGVEREKKKMGGGRVVKVRGGEGEGEMEEGREDGRQRGREGEKERGKKTNTMIWKVSGSGGKNSAYEDEEPD